MPQGLERSNENEAVSSRLERRASIMELACRNIINAISWLSSVWRAHIRQGRKCLRLYRSQLSQNHLSLDPRQMDLRLNKSVIQSHCAMPTTHSALFKCTRATENCANKHTHRVGRMDGRTDANRRYIFKVGANTPLITN